MTDAQPQNERTPGFLRRIQSVLLLLGVMWALEAIDWMLPGNRLDDLGIRPRTLPGIACIPLAPFLHAGFAHLMANTLPFLVLGWLVVLRSHGEFILATVMTTLVGGAGVWLIGASESIHLGASSLVFGYLGCLLLRAYFERTPLSLIVSILVGVVYGGYLWGVCPGADPDVSWESHLLGFVGGVRRMRATVRFRGSITVATPSEGVLPVMTACCFSATRRVEKSPHGAKTHGSFQVEQPSPRLALREGCLDFPLITANEACPPWTASRNGHSRRNGSQALD